MTPSVARVGDHPVRLDVELLLRAGLVFALDDDLGLGPRGVDVAAGDEVALEDVVLAPDDLAAGERFDRVEDGGHRLDVDGDVTPRLLEQQPIGVREEDDRLLGVIDPGVGEVRLIVGDQRDDVLAGNVAGANDGELVPRKRGIEANLADRAARDRAPDGRAVQHPGQRQVVDVAGLARDLGAPFFPGNRSTDRCHRVRYRCRSPAVQ